MATLSIPHSFVPGTPALASEVNANFQAVVSWTQGQISTDNFGILGARSVALPSSPTLAILSLAQTSSNIALNISNSGTESALAISQSGALANGKGAILINSPSNQTTSGAAELLMTLNTNSSIPAILVNHGAVQTMSLTRTQLNLYASALQLSGTAVTFFTNAFQASSSQLLLFNSAIELNNARVKLPVRTTAERNAVTQEGSVLYNSDKKELAFRTNSTWIPASTPTGCVQMFAGSTAPQGWLYCNGQAVSRTTYADLFAVIGTTYGSGDGSTTFNVPNFVGIFPRGAAMSGTTTQVISGITYTGGSLNDKQTDQIQNHKHVQLDPAGGTRQIVEVQTQAGGGTFVNVYRGIENSTWNTGELSTGRTGNETRPANISIAYIIKA